MTRAQRGWVFLWAVLIAVFMALTIRAVKADEEYEGCDPNDTSYSNTCYAIYRPGICQYLEPYTYWWGFWGCENQNNLMATVESVTYDFRGDGRVFVEIIREYPGGHRSFVIRELKGR